MLARACHSAGGALALRLRSARLAHHLAAPASTVAAPQRRRRVPQAGRLVAAAAEAEASAEGAPPAPASAFKDLGVDSRLLVRAGAETRLAPPPPPLARRHRRLRPAHRLLSLPSSLSPQPFLEQQGIAAPTEVQAASIGPILEGKNAAVRCYTGSGKTLAYLLPALTLAVARAEAEWSAATRKTAGQAGTVQVVVVAPSRELAMQIMRVAQSLLPESARRGVQQAIGGANIWRQRENLKARFGCLACVVGWWLRGRWA